jgi:hypothetical protein
VIVLTDDQGFGDLSLRCDNSTGLCARTPNLDALMTSPHTALFHRFYSGAGVCSPTRAALLTGRSNMRDCIITALPCDSEDPAPTCAMGAGGALPVTEFTLAEAAKKTLRGNYTTAFFGKWHLGDLWHKDLPNLNPHWPVSSPGNHGFDEWVRLERQMRQMRQMRRGEPLNRVCVHSLQMATQAEASSSMSNCGCFPVNHTHPGPEPPSGWRHAQHIQTPHPLCTTPTHPQHIQARVTHAHTAPYSLTHNAFNHAHSQRLQGHHAQRGCVRCWGRVCVRLVLPLHRLLLPERVGPAPRP